MEDAIIRIQSAYRGYATRKSNPPHKPEHNSIDWKFHTSGNLYKSSIFPITDDYHKGLQPEPPYQKVLSPVPSNPNPHQTLSSKSFTLQKKPLITLFFQEIKTQNPSSPQAASPARSSRASVSKPSNFSISPQKSAQKQSNKTEVTLFKYTLIPYTKPVVPIQTCNPKQRHREKFIKQINGITLKLQTNKPQELARPKTQKSDKRPNINMAKSVSTRSKFVSVDKYSSIYPDTSIKKFDSGRQSFYGKQSAPNSGLQSNFECNKVQGKLCSPYESIWTEKLLLNFYNLKIFPSQQSGRKRFKLVKVDAKRRKKLSADMTEKYLNLL